MAYDIISYNIAERYKPSDGLSVDNDNVHGITLIIE